VAPHYTHTVAHARRGPQGGGDSLKTLADGDLMKGSGTRQLQPYLGKSVARCTLVGETMCVPVAPHYTHTVAHARRGPPGQQLWQALWGCPPPHTQRTTVVDLGDPLT